MPIPIVAPYGFGNILPPTPLAAGASVAVVVDLSAVVDTAIFCDLTTGGGTAPTTATPFAVYPCYGSTALTADVAAGAVTFTPASTVGLTPGRLVAIIPVSGPGELVTIVGQPAGGVVPCSPTQGAYPAGSTAWLHAQSPFPVVLPSDPNGRWKPNATYSPPPLHVGNGIYVLAATGPDRPVVVAISAFETRGFG